MPGQNPNEAVKNFLAPLQVAIGCITQAHISVSSYRQYVVEEERDWMLNSGEGVVLKRRWATDENRPFQQLDFFASMWWKVIEDDRDGYGPFRVTTVGYGYSLLGDDRELWAMHWHPNGQSDVRYPHIHLGDIVLSGKATVTSKNHLPTSRMTLEAAIRWAIEWGAEPVRSDWEDRLLLAESPHLLFRTWSSNPDVEAQQT